MIKLKKEHIHDLLFKWFWFGTCLNTVFRLQEFFRMLSEGKSNIDQLYFSLTGCLTDNIYWLSIFSVLYSIFKIFNKLGSAKLINTLFTVFLSVYFLSAVALSEYYIFQLFPLDSVITKASLAYFKWVMEMTVDFSFATFLPFILIPLPIIIFPFIQNRIQLPKTKFSYLLIILGFLAIPVYFTNINFGFKSISDYFTYTNKLKYLTNTVFEDIKSSNKLKQLSEDEINEAFLRFQKDHPKEYTSTEYPLLHKNEYEDVLGQYFEIDPNNKPNIVIILYESLGKSYSGPDAKLMSVTPFLDSLSEHSLYFENIISPAERTFGVTGNVLASAPMGNEGFLAIPRSMPAHQSIISIAKDNGYSAFYHEGHNNWGNFPEDPTSFFSKQNIDSITFGADTILPDPYQPWIPDGEVFRGVANQIVTDTSAHPRLDIILTASSHNPFKDTPNEPHYRKMVYGWMDKNAVSTEVRHKIESDILRFSSFAYVDEQLKQFFSELHQTQKDSNTIFLIVGDHCEFSIEPNNPLQKFHIPLVIYSPLLKAAKHFPAVSSHYDILPSLLAMLQNKAGFKLNSNTHWIGQGLDTASHFRCNRSFGQMAVSRLFREYVYKDYYVNGDFLMKIKPGLETEIDSDPELLSKIKQMRSDFEIVSRLTYANNKICPYGQSAFANTETIPLFDTTYSTDPQSNGEYVGIGEYRAIKGWKHYDINIRLKGNFNYAEGEEPSMVISSQGVFIMDALSKGKETTNAKGEKELVFNYSQPVFPFSKAGETVKIFIWNTKKTRLQIDSVNCHINARRHILNEEMAKR